MVPFPLAAGRPNPPANPMSGRTDVGRPASRRRWPYALLLMIVLAAGVLFQTPPGRDVLRSAGVLGTPAAYTELAFTGPGDLPQQLVAANVTKLPAFEIHNVTGAAHRYRWSVTLSSARGAVQAATGEAPVADGRVATLAPSVRVECRPGPLTVTVRLATSGESINFRADCLAADSGDLS
jgi:hypothetical protein